MHDWEWSYHDYRPEQERLREALCTVGNGYFASSGAAPESVASAHHYPDTFLAGGYDKAKTEIQGRMVENEDLVNLPNWLPLRLRFADGDWFNPDQVELLDYRQRLDLRNVVLERLIRFRDPGGRETQLRQRRLVHMAHQHLAGLETELTPCNWSGSVEVLSALYTSRDAAISECGLEARSALASLPRFAALQASNALIWQQLWRRFDLELGLRHDDDGRTAAILRLHLFHLPVTAAPTVMDLDAGVPARGLHGEAYRGHIFWDELFIFPTLNLRLPEITRSLLIRDQDDSAVGGAEACSLRASETHEFERKDKPAFVEAP